MTGQTYVYSIPVARSGTYRVFVPGRGPGGPSFTLSNARPHQAVSIQVRSRFVG